MIDNYFTQTIVIESCTETINSETGRVEKTFQTASTIKGYIDNEVGGRYLIGGRYNQEYTCILFCHIGTNISGNSRIVKGNTRYKVVAINSIYNHHMEVYLTELGVDSI